MTDAEFATAVLKELRDAISATHTLDIGEIATRLGVAEKYQTQRVAERLRLEGLIESEGFTPDSLLAHITDKGRTALETGNLGQVVDPASALETGVGREKEAGHGR